MIPKLFGTTLRGMLVLPLLFATAPLAAEQARTGGATGPVNLMVERPGMSPEAALELRARIDLRAVGLASALLALRENSGAPVAFSPSRVAGLGPVSCRCRELSVRDALDLLLQDTPFEYQAVSGRILIARNTQSEAGGIASGARNGPVPAEVIRAGEERMRLRVRTPRWSFLVRTGTITGEVTEAGTGRALSGVQMSLPGTNMGTLTDGDGRYRIDNVPAGEVRVQARFLGFAVATRTVTVVSGQTLTLDFELREQVLGLDEIVVTGQAGQARRREVGNAIVQLNMRDIAEPISTVESLLQARATGVRVTFTDASIGSGARIRLRGNVSVSQGNQPLIYIDGVRQAGDQYRSGGNTKSAGPLADINPQDVERIEVIKGAAAATLYGSEAAAGVIQIFTRRGADGTPSFTYQTDQSLSWVRPWGSSERPRLNMDPWLRTAHGQRHVLSVTGGSDRIRYFVSGSVVDRDGAQVDEFENRYSVRSNLMFQATQSLGLEVNSMFSHHEFETQPSGNALASIFFNVYRAPNNFVGGAWPHEPEFVDQINSLRSRTVQTANQRQNVGLTANWTPFANFSTRVTMGYDRMQQDQMTVLPFGYPTRPDGQISVADWHNSALTWDLASNYRARLADNVRTTLSAGGQLYQRRTHSFTATGRGLPGPGEHNLSSTADRSVGQSGIRVNTGGFFLQQMLDFHDRYFLTAGVRADGSSAFGSDFGLEVYPKVSASYVISEEDFWPAGWGDVKLRAAYGFAGRAPGAFDAVRTWSPSSFRGQTAFSPANIGNPNLGPERTAELEIGFDAAFIENRLTTDFTYYHQVTSEGLFGVGQPPSLGFGGSQLENIGKLKNTGIELALGMEVLDRPTFGWDLGTTITTNRSEILDMGGIISYSLVEGQPAPVMRGARVVNRDEFADPDYEFDAFFGPRQPTLIVGLHTSMRLPRGIFVTARGEFQGGHWMTDFASRLMAQRTGPGALGCDPVYRHVGSDDYLGPGDDHPNLDRVRALDRARCYARARNDVWIMPADFAKLREITVQAPVPFEIPGAQSAQATLSFRDLFRWTNSEWASHDPETSGTSSLTGLTEGSITDHVPPPASVTLSVRVQF